MSLTIGRNDVKGKHRTRGKAETTVGAIWFIDVDHTIFEGENLHWTQSDACSTTKTAILVDHEFMVRNSPHDRWKRMS
jgi:hypothetical protein